MTTDFEPTIRTGRDALLEQLEYLAEEASALQSVIRHVPGPILEARPLPGELSVKELYALLVCADETVHRSAVQELAAGRQPELGDLDPEVLLADRDWNDVPIARILTRLSRSRRDLVQLARRAEPEVWGTDEFPLDGSVNLFSYLYDVVQHDVEVLRMLGERLHEARFSQRLQDVPR